MPHENIPKQEQISSSAKKLKWFFVGSYLLEKVALNGALYQLWRLEAYVLIVYPRTDDLSWIGWPSDS